MCVRELLAVGRFYSSTQFCKQQNLMEVIFGYMFLNSSRKLFLLFLPESRNFTGFDLSRENQIRVNRLACRANQIQRDS